MQVPQELSPKSLQTHTLLHQWHHSAMPPWLFQASPVDSLLSATVYSNHEQLEGTFMSQPRAQGLVQPALGNDSKAQADILLTCRMGQALPMLLPLSSKPRGEVCSLAFQTLGNKSMFLSAQPLTGTGSHVSGSVGVQMWSPTQVFSILHRTQPLEWLRNSLLRPAH